MTKLPLSFVSGLRPGYIASEDLSVSPLKKDDTLLVPPGLLTAYVGAPPSSKKGSAGGLEVRPSPGTFAIVTLPDLGHTTRVYLIES